MKSPRPASPARTQKHSRTEVLEGRVRREYVAPDAARARSAFTALARELTEQAGIGWRRRFVDGRDHYEVGRCALSLEGNVVHLHVQAPAEVRRLFR